MFCTQCGQGVEPEDKFCWNCGVPIARKQPGSAARSSSASAGRDVASASSTTDMPRPGPAAASPTLQPSSENINAPAPEMQERQVESGEELLPLTEEPQTPAAAGPPVSPEQAPGITPAESQSIAADAAAAAAIEPSGAGADLPSGQAKAAPEVLYDSVGNELAADDRALDLGPADTPTPTFGGYAARDAKAPRANVASQKAQARDIGRPPVATPAIGSGSPRGRKSLLGVLEIAICVVLVLAVGGAVWMVFSSPHAKSAAPVRTVNVTVSPANAEVTAGKAFDFVVTVTGTDDPRVSWTVQEGDAGGRIVTHGSSSNGGQVSSKAVYVAPDKPGTYHLLAASEADPQKPGAAEIKVTKR